jgi:hypothetical protein
LSTAFSPLLGSLVGSGHCGVKRRKLSHHALIGILFIGVDGLSMLAKIVETRELLAAMASERTFASVFPEGVGSEPGASGRGGGRARNTNLMCLARCSLLLKTMRQSP